MVSLYIKILKKTITGTELELFKYNLDISCCVPHAIFFNLNSEAKYLFFNNYVNECSKRLKRYYFKFDPESKSDDSCIIYADDENLLDTINMINIVLNKNKSLLGNVNKPQYLNY